MPNCSAPHSGPAHHTGSDVAFGVKGQLSRHIKDHLCRNVNLHFPGAACGSAAVSEATSGFLIGGGALEEAGRPCSTLAERAASASRPSA